jgi:hypothetical protein
MRIELPSCAEDVFTPVAQFGRYDAWEWNRRQVVACHDEAQLAKFSPCGFVWFLNIIGLMKMPAFLE